MTHQCHELRELGQRYRRDHGRKGLDHLHDVPPYSQQEMKDLEDPKSILAEINVMFIRPYQNRQ